MLQLIDVLKRFGPVLAVDQMSITVEQGQIVSLLGPSGCGKTTTLRLIAGFETPDRGRIELDGSDVSDLRPYERNVGLLFQDYALFPHMTVSQNIAYGPRRRGASPQDADRRVDELLLVTRLKGLGERYPGHLSGGQQQRVALARALAINPQVLLLDEPLSALDAQLRQELRVELKEILRSVGTTTIIVTHDQEEAMGLAERILVMDRGRVVQQGTPTEIYTHPANRFVAEFIGRSNWFSGNFGPERGDGLIGFIADDGVVLSVPAALASTAASVDLCLRPERITLAGPAEREPNRSPGHNALHGKVINAAVLGALVHYVVELPGGRRLLLVERNLGRPPRPEGSGVYLQFHARDLIAVPAEAPKSGPLVEADRISKAVQEEASNR